MKVVRVKRVVDGIEYKIPYVVMSKLEKDRWIFNAEKFYQSTFDDLDFRVEPYQVDENNS